MIQSLFSCLKGRSLDGDVARRGSVSLMAVSFCG